MQSCDVMKFDRKSHFGSVGLVRVGVDLTMCFVKEYVCISKDGNKTHLIFYHGDGSSE